MLTSKLPREVKTFVKLLNELSQEEKDLLLWRFVDGKSMKWVAKKMKKQHNRAMTDSRVKQIEDKLIREIELEFDLYI